MSGWVMKSVQGEERPFIIAHSGAGLPPWRPGTGQVQKPLCPPSLSGQKVLHKFISPGIFLLTTKQSTLMAWASTVREPSWISHPTSPRDV